MSCHEFQKCATKINATLNQNLNGVGMGVSSTLSQLIIILLNGHLTKLSALEKTDGMRHNCNANFRNWKEQFCSWFSWLVTDFNGHYHPWLCSNSCPFHLLSGPINGGSIKREIHTKIVTKTATRIEIKCCQNLEVRLRFEANSCPRTEAIAPTFEA